MNTTLFSLSIVIALVGPVVAISYLRPILERVLRGLCAADGGAEFWIRCAYVLAVTGTMLLMLSFGSFEEGSRTVDTLRRSLWLVLLGIFVTIAFISKSVWAQVRATLDARRTPTSTDSSVQS